MWVLNKSCIDQRKAAQKAADNYKSMMKGKKTILVPHPTIPKTWIEKIIPNDDEYLNQLQYEADKINTI